MLRETEVRQPKERWRLGVNSAEGCRLTQSTDRLSLKSACGLRVSRPLRAVCRRLLGVREAVAIVAGAKSVHRRTVHRGLGRA